MRVIGGETTKATVGVLPLPHVPVPDEGRGHYRGRECRFLLSSGVKPQPVSKQTLSGARH